MAKTKKTHLKKSQEGDGKKKSKGGETKSRSKKEEEKGEEQKRRSSQGAKDHTKKKTKSKSEAKKQKGAATPTPPPSQSKSAEAVKKATSANPPDEKQKKKKKKTTGDHEKQPIKQKEMKPPPPKHRHFTKKPEQQAAEREASRTPRRALFADDDATSGITSPCISLGSLKQWKEEAQQKGMSLEEYMEDVSVKEMEKELDSHMHQLVVQTKSEEKPAEEPEKKNNDEENKPTEKESESDSSSSESSESDDESEEEEKSHEDEDDAKEEGQDDDDDEEEEDEEGEEGDDLDGEKLSSDDEDDGQLVEAIEDQLKPDETPQSAPTTTSTPTPQQSLVAAAAQQHQATPAPPAAPDYSKANSSSHKSEWDKFARQCLDRKKFPTSLASHYIKDKTDLFRVEVTFQRKAKKVSTSRKERQGTKARDLLKAYPKEKAEALMKTLRSKGLWYFDADFPGDEEEIFYYTNNGNKIRDDDMVIESAAVGITDKGNQEIAEALISGDGPLGPGARPNVITATEEGQKNLLAAMEPDTQVEKKKEKKNKKGDESTEKQEPTTLDEIVHAKMDECLKKGAEARKFAISLGSLEYSGDLASQLMTFSSKMEKVFKCLQDLRQRKVASESSYQKHFNIIQDKLTWYTQAEAAAKALQNGLKPKKKSKKDKKDKEEKTEKTEGDSPKPTAA